MASLSPAAEAASPPRAGAPRALARWLHVVAALIVLIVVVGGITRLTESGLSITEWKPVSGILPPLTDAAWEQAFADYRRIPEYQLLNQGMTLAQFKAIFFWEYVHRVLGRVIGLALILPLAWFWWRRMIPAGYAPRLIALAALVGLQGALGWWMVASGLEDRVDVSHLRLAAHLLTALFLLAGVVWTARDLAMLARDPAARPARLTGLGAIVAVVLFAQLLLGAFVAGLNAGLVTNEWPLMNGRLVPAAEFGARGFWDAIVNDPWVVHFLHRWWAWVTVAALILLARGAKRRGGRRESVAIHATFGIQILLGIATVMTGVDIVLAVLHQAVGALLVIAVACGAHQVGAQTPSGRAG